MKSDYKKWLKALIFPHPALFFLLIPLSVILLLLAFLKFGTEHPFSIVAYVVSAYTLGTFSIIAVPLTKKIIHYFKSHPITGRLMEDRALRARLSLYGALIYNTAYGIFNIVAGLVIPTAWLFALGIYFITLAVIRFTLFITVRSARKAPSEEARIAAELSKYRFAGWSLLFLNIAISGMILQMIYQNRGFSYPGLLIYVFAAYAFLKLTATIVNLVKFHKLSTPVLSASKAIDLAVSLISMFCLQTAMFASFGADMAPENMYIMNLATGIGVGVGLLLISVSMILHAHLKKNNKIHQNERKPSAED